MNRPLEKIRILVLILAISPATSLAVSYPPQLFHREVRHDKFEKGEVLYLFHSGTEEVKKTIHIGDTLAVYRISPSCIVSPIGLVIVLGYVEETYMKAEVFAGEIRPDDIARKGNVSLIAISAGRCGE